MGKKIGIKLADGTFYPIMDDGVPQKKLMELTTVQDNQTTASIDLYRSESGTMEDAEYVDTLELSELVPHPGGETSIRFTLQLHEDNTLSAEVADPESGQTNATTSDLINLPTEKKRSSTDTVSAVDIFDANFEEPPLPESPANSSTGEQEEVLAQAATPQPSGEKGVGIADFDLSDFDLDDFSSVDSLPSTSSKDDGTSGTAFPTFEDDSPEESDAVSEIPATLDDLPDFGDVSLDLGGDASGQMPAFDFESLGLGDSATTDVLQGEDSGGEGEEKQNSDGSDALLAAGIGAATLGLGAATLVASDNDQDDDSHLNALLGKDDTVADGELDASGFDLPDFDDGSLSSDDTAADGKLDASSFDLPDFDDGSLSSDDTAADGKLDASGFDLPDFDDGSLSSDDTVADGKLDASSFDLPDFDDGSLSSDDTVADGKLDASSFDLPDFDFGNNGDDFGSSHQDTTVYEDSLPDFSKFELPDFDEPVRNDFSFGEESGLFNENDFKDPAFYTNDTAASSYSPLDFSGLYDDRENELKQQENRRKRGGISVAVCIICALICVGILLFILFLLPSKLSDSRNAGNQVSVTDSHTVTVSQQEMEAAPDSTAAVEDVIVIVETPAVVPAPPPQATKASEVVRYEVKWGDTLWDIAQSYYNNPWLYKRIATANNIKNPDYIVAGTILTIPPQ